MAAHDPRCPCTFLGASIVAVAPPPTPRGVGKHLQGALAWIAAAATPKLMGWARPRSGR